MKKIKINLSSEFSYKFFLFLLLGCMFMFTKAISQPMVADQHRLVFAFIQDQFIFNYSNIKSASIIYRDNGSYEGLHLVLKPDAANQFSQLTLKGIGKPIILIFDNKIISMAILNSKLSGDLQMTGVSKTDALTFINMLSKYQQEENNKST